MTAAMREYALFYDLNANDAQTPFRTDLHIQNNNEGSLAVRRNGCTFTENSAICAVRDLTVKISDC
jgi:hypothetical protein